MGANETNMPDLVSSLEGVTEFLQLPPRKDFHHTLLERVIRLNETLELGFNTLGETERYQEDLQQPLVRFCEAYSDAPFDSGLHRVRNNIVASIGSLLFITECRLRLFVNDDAWCDLDAYFREKDHFFNKEMLFRVDLFLEHDLPFFNTHPLVQYSMSQCEQTLQALLRSKVSYTNNSEAFRFVEILSGAIFDRISILINYPYSLDVHDLPQYVVRIGNDRAVCTSAFAYDFSVLCRTLRSRMRQFKLLEPVLEHGAEKFYQPFLESVRKPFLNWAGGMVITAAGDDFCDLFTKFYCNSHVQDYERLLYRRMFPNIGKIIPYKLLEALRGMDIANAIMAKGGESILNLIKYVPPNDESDQDEPDDSMCTTETIVERMNSLQDEQLDLLVMAILDYVLERQWNRTIRSFLVDSVSANVENEPKILWVPFHRTFVVLSKAEDSRLPFTRFRDAFAVFAYQLQKHYDGILFNSQTNERLLCAPLLKKLFAI